MKCKCQWDLETDDQTCSWFTRKLSGKVLQPVTQSDFDTIFCITQGIPRTTYTVDMELTSTIYSPGTTFLTTTSRTTTSLTITSSSTPSPAFTLGRPYYLSLKFTIN